MQLLLVAELGEAFFVGGRGRDTHLRLPCFGFFPCFGSRAVTWATACRDDRPPSLRESMINGKCVAAWHVDQQTCPYQERFAALPAAAFLCHAGPSASLASKSRGGAWRGHLSLRGLAASGARFAPPPLMPR